MLLYFRFKTLLLIGTFFCFGCARVPDNSINPPGLELKKIIVEQLPGFETDKVGDALFAFRKSCKKIYKKNPNARFGGQSYAGLVRDWATICTGLPSLGSGNKEYRQFPSDLMVVGFWIFLESNCLNKSIGSILQLIP